MTSLRQQMIDAMVLRGLAGRTQECYVAVVAQLASYYHCSPDRLDAEQVKAWLLHRISERHLAYATINQAVCAIKFLFSAVLGREADAIAISYARTPQRQPEILSREELARLFDSAGNLRSRTLLMTTYAAGLRVSEVCALRVADIDSAPDRMCIRVVEGKGGKDRYTLLTPCLLEALRQYWRLCKPRLWLFPRVSDPAQPFDICCAQRAYHRARERAGIQKGAAFMACATPLPRICWRPVLIWPRWPSCSDTATCPPPNATCIWPDPAGHCSRTAHSIYCANSEAGSRGATDAGAHPARAGRGIPAQPCPVARSRARLARHCRLPNRCPWRRARTLRWLRCRTPRLSFLQKPALPSMSDPG